MNLLFMWPYFGNSVLFQILIDLFTNSMDNAQGGRTQNNIEQKGTL